MDDTIITTYYLCEEFLKAVGHRDDRQVRLATAEVMCTALVAAAFLGANIEKTRSFLDEYGYIEKAISKSRFNRRLHAIDPHLWRALFDLLGEAFKRSHDEQSYVVDSLPVAVCDNIRIKRCRIYPRQEHEEAFRGYVASKRRYFYGLRVHLVVRVGRVSRWSSKWRRLRRPMLRCSRKWIWTCPKERPSTPTRATPTTITKICSKRSG